ncbi:ABC transporter ATP-binding protein [Streptosporangium sp. NPDC051023]|uniref:ABC transporter ATP-binding protein n=1 Tax=Streptosporangium sp. NPDC051023 TaxID=3155410 RepID=UPI00344FE72D
MAETVLLSDEPSSARLLRRAWPHLRPYSGRMLVALLLSLAESASLVALAPLIGVAVEALTANDRDRLLTTVALLAGLVVAQALLARFAATTLANAGEHVARGLRERAAERLAEAPLRFIEAHRDGSLLQRATGEIAELAMFVRTALPNLLGVTATLAFTTVVLLAYSWPLTLVVVAVFLAPAVLVTRWFAKDAGPAFGAHAGAEATMAATFAETLDAREELRAAGGLPAWMARFDRDNLATLATQRRTVLVENRIGAITLVEGAAMAVLLVFGAWLAVEGHLSVGTVVVFVLAGRNLFEGFGDLSQLAGEVQTVRAGLARLLDLLAAGVPEPGGDRPLPVKGELLAEKVTFRYEGDAEVLREVSVGFAEDAHAGLVGETGSGKTTLSKILSGLYRPDSGRVTFGGVDLSEASPDEVRRRIALVPQEVHTVSGSVADNLALAQGEPGRADMEAAFEALGISAFAQGLPRGLDTPAGDLSAGERQILGLVRAVLADPAVLILDEATADVDPVTARSLETALARLRESRALIVIAHRPSTIELLPRLVALRAGVLETGNEN